MKMALGLCVNNINDWLQLLLTLLV